MHNELPKRGSRTAKHQSYINHDKRDTMTPMSPFLGVKEKYPLVNGQKLIMPKPIPKKG